MKLPHEFYQLPYVFDTQQMQQEVKRFDSTDWVPHHEGFKGNFSIPLISVNGENNNLFKGPMMAAKPLFQSEYIQQILASFGEVFGRSRLMGLAPGCEVPLHSDINYHWYKRVRIHIPIVTDEKVVFHCGDKQVHMKAGECWIFNSWKYHKVVNHSDVFRVHLVVDTAGSSAFWERLNMAKIPWVKQSMQQFEPKKIPYQPGESSKILTESFNVPLVMSPGEMDGLVADLLQEINQVEGNEFVYIEEMTRKVQMLCADWRKLWSLYGMQEAGWRHYHELRVKAFESVRHLDNKLKLTNGTQAPRMLLHCIIDSALNVEVKNSFNHC
ncbi:MAG: hypothetical protein ACI96W_003333 [Paraglaciecola sp.]|jgi:hypothetical protein